MSICLCEPKINVGARKTSPNTILFYLLFWYFNPLYISPVDMGMGLARVEVRDYVQRATIPSKKIVLCLTLLTPHAMLDKTWLFIKWNIFSPVRLKINHVTEIMQHVFILGAIDWIVANNTYIFNVEICETIQIT